LVESKERNDGGKAVTFIENETLEVPTYFHPNFLTHVTLLFPVWWERWKLKKPYAT